MSTSAPNTDASQNNTGPLQADCLLNAAQTISETQTTVTVHYEPVTGRGCISDGTNPVQHDQVSDHNRAKLFTEYDQAIASVVPDRLYMPLGSEGQKPLFAEKGISLDSDQARGMLHEPHEAAKAIRNGHRGFLIYPGYDDHCTVGLCIGDHDHLDAFPTDELPTTLTVMSGGGNRHTYFRNDGTVENGKCQAGEIKAGVANGESKPSAAIVPGSVHPDGGVYHIYREHPIVELSNDQIPELLHPSSGGNNSGGSSTTTSGTNVWSDSAIELVPRDELDKDTVNQCTNDRGKTLDECREIDSYLDTLLTEKHIDDPKNTYDDGLIKDYSQIEEKLVSRCRYHWFDRQQQADILRCYRQQFRDAKPEKLNRYDYIVRTIEAFSNDLSRAVYDGSFGSHIVYRPLTGDSDGFVHVTQDSARDRCQETINDAMANGSEVLIDAVPSLGKSSGTIRAVKHTGIPATILTARHDLYDQHNRWAEEHDLSIQTLPSFVRNCGCMTGDHGDAWQERMDTLYKAGVSPSVIHSKATEEFGEQPPCCRDGSCGYTDAYDFAPSEYDLIVGHYTHAYNTNMIEDRMVVFDEFVGEAFIEKFDANETAAIVSSWLNQFDDSPVDTVDDVKRVNTNASFITDDLNHLNQWMKENATIDHEMVTVGSTDQHLLAPVLVDGLMSSDDLGNGWDCSYVEIPNEIGHETTTDRYEFAKNRESQDIHILNQPDLSEAHGVIALDGTPSMDLWRTALGIDELDRERILDDSERQQYIRDVLGMEIVPLTDSAAYPCSGGYNSNQYLDRETSMIESVDRMHNESPSLITSDAVLKSYDDMIDELVEEPMNYANVVSSNAFERKTLGIVNGSSHYGDGYCKKWAALNSECTERIDGTEGMNTEFTTDIGNEALDHMRESQVTQAILRFGRHKSVDESTVYVNTAAFHSWLPTSDCGEVVKASDRRVDVITALVNGPSVDATDKDRDYMTYEDISDQDHLDVGKQSIRKTLNELENYGYVDIERPPGESPQFTPTARLHQFVM